MSSAPEPNIDRPSFSVARVLLVIVPALVVIGAVYAVTKGEFDRAAHEKEPTLQAQMGFGAAASPLQLDSAYTDADGDLVADCPKDAAKQISPDKLIFSFVASSEAQEDRANWKKFVDFLSERTGKPVEMVAYKTTDEQIQALKNGKLHITGFNTGAVPLAVNTAGFVPLCVTGDKDGNALSYTMQIIVPAESQIYNPPQLKDHTIAFTDRTSNSGYKAAIVRLKDEGLLPVRDYNCRFSGGHERSIQGISAGEYQAATVASDMLRRAVANGTVDFAKIRVIDQSKPFPPATLGYAYNLSPNLAEKIKPAFLEFPWAGTGLEKQFAGTGATKFVPVSYKNDFEWTRLIADAVQDPPDIAIEKDQASAQ